MTRLIAIDPGSSESAFVGLETFGGEVFAHGKYPNARILEELRAMRYQDGRGGPFAAAMLRADRVVCEWMQPRGMPTSAQEFETVFYVGRFAEALAVQGFELERLTRHRVKVALIGSGFAGGRTRGAKLPSADTMIRAALVDRFGGPGGKAAAIGLKASPGPLYGIHADEWAALALAVAWADVEALGDRTARLNGVQAGSYRAGE